MGKSNGGEGEGALLSHVIASVSATRSTCYLQPDTNCHPKLLPEGCIFAYAGRAAGYIALFSRIAG